MDTTLPPALSAAALARLIDRAHAPLLLDESRRDRCGASCQLLPNPLPVCCRDGHTETPAWKHHEGPAA